MDTYLGAEVNMPEGDGYWRAVVRKRKRDEEGRPIGQGNNNPILDTRIALFLIIQNKFVLKVNIWLISNSLQKFVIECDEIEF